MRRSRLKPAVVLGALSAACLAVFLASIPLPQRRRPTAGRRRLRLLRLPAVGRPRPRSRLRQPGRRRCSPPGGTPLLAARTPTGLPFNYWPVGPALLWLPFFLLAHGLALRRSTPLGVAIRLDGCGYWHQAFVIAGNIAYGGMRRCRWPSTLRGASWRDGRRRCGRRAARLRGQPRLLHDRRAVDGARGRGVRREPLLRGLAADPRAPRDCRTRRCSARWSA